MKKGNLLCGFLRENTKGLIVWDDEYIVPELAFA